MTYYTIISVDDSRKEVRDALENTMNDWDFKFFDTGVAVDGRDPEQLKEAMRSSPWYEITGKNFHNGEIGIWFSQINALEAIAFTGETTTVFEDDAVVHPIFKEIYPLVIGELPDDWDFFAWAIPHDQKVDYYYNRAFDELGNWHIVSYLRHPYTGSPHYIGADLVCKAYQGYQAVAVMYSQRGARRIQQLARRQGIDTPYDLFLFREHHKGNLNGYTLLPDVYPAVTYEELGTIARESGMYN